MSGPVTPLRRYSSLIGLATTTLLLVACSSDPTSPTPPPPPTPNPPTLTCPADITQQSPNDGPVVVTYQTPAAVDGSLPVTVACVPPSGSSFAPGTTAVKCTATDAVGRTAACGFNVKITLVPKLSKTRFCAFGDSMTSGVISLRSPFYSLTPSPTSYPGRLQVLLSARYTTQAIAVDDQGLPGELAADGLVRLPGVIRDTRPEVVLLLEGANDLNDFGSAGLEDTVWAMDQMVVAVNAAGAVPFLATLPPQRPGGYRAIHPELVAPYNARLAQVASSAHANLVDIYAAFGGVASTTLIGSDGLHPTEAGYQKMAEAFAAVIQSKLEPTAATIRRPIKAR
jgi:lysophospholipase L1-like esterase